VVVECFFLKPCCCSMLGISFQRKVSKKISMVLINGKEEK
jgi:hypothetical protein